MARDILPDADIIHDVPMPQRDTWGQAFSIVRTGTRFAQLIGTMRGVRHGMPVAVWLFQTFDSEQETGPKGYLNDDEVIWRREIVCFHVPRDLLK
ncbi:hypothetical protein [uncultured Brevundimonas sp.]|uniref:hypothetical protein n=1 Tax=uncultured Brevundimonas sp. TaxID=213418 RepID=UPI0025935EA8|nr:hypothetical protein [uncultured Brevundimonas sp.]